MLFRSKLVAGVTAVALALFFVKEPKAEESKVIESNVLEPNVVEPS